MSEGSDGGGTVVVDASVAVKWLIDEEDSDSALELLERWARDAVVVAAPPLLHVEVANILYQRIRRGGLEPREADLALQGLAESALLTRIAAGEPTLISVASTFGLTAVYDATYLQLAMHLGCSLWTADKRLVNVVRPRASWIRQLGE